MGGIRSQNHHHHQHGCRRRRRHHLDIYGWGGRSDHGTPLECSSSSHSTTPKVSAMELCFCFNISKDYCDALQALCSHNSTYYATTVIHISDNELCRVCSATLRPLAVPIKELAAQEAAGQCNLYPDIDYDDDYGMKIRRSPCDCCCRALPPTIAVRRDPYPALGPTNSPCGASIRRM